MSIQYSIWPLWWRERVTSLLDVFYPRRCEGCDREADAGGYLCWDCFSRMDYIKDPMCSRCGDPVSGSVDHRFECGWCTRTRPSFDAARSAVRFRGAARQALHRYKYQHATHLSCDFGSMLSACVEAYFGDEILDAVTYVPLHSVKARERSYNQSRLLAEALGHQWRLPVARQVLERIRFTRTQTRLTADQRAQNVSGAFRARQPDWIEGRRWLLVDDVMTTGATVNECARVLKKHGAVSVFVVTVARG